MALSTFTLLFSQPSISRIYPSSQIETLSPLNPPSPLPPPSSLLNFKWDRKPSETFKQGTWSDFILRNCFSITLLQFTALPSSLSRLSTYCMLGSGDRVINRTDIPWDTHHHPFSWEDWFKQRHTQQQDSILAAPYEPVFSAWLKYIWHIILYRFPVSILMIWYILYALLRWLSQ